MRTPILMPGLPPGLHDLSGMNLAPSIWVGGPLRNPNTGADWILPGDMVQIVAVTKDGDIFVEITDGYVVGFVPQDCLKPWLLS